MGFVPQAGAAGLELTIVIPCLNEAETLAQVIDRARRFLHAYDVSGEVIVADNGSTDGSTAIAIGAGARVVPVAERGYGAALRAGIDSARGTYVAMADADCSYDFMDLMPFLDRLRSGTELVVGNRFLGGIGKGAMPPLHRYLGNPVLSLAGRVFFRAPIGDFHCGLRAFRRDSILELGLSSPGMEFASEMIVKAQLAGVSMSEVPATLAKDGRSRPPHLRSWRDGWRHLKFLLLFAPRSLYLYPGLGLFALSFAVFLGLLPGDVSIGSVRFGVHSLLFAGAGMLIGAQMMSFGLLAGMFGARERYWSAGCGLERARALLTIDKGSLIGGAMMLAGLAGAVVALASWAGAGFSDMNPDTLMRVSIPSVLSAGIGLQLMLTSFLLELLAHPARQAQK
ncbi:MAG TPA: glycosyltransferase family 2 protein [Allosphingosinicella sp.]